MPSPGRLFRDRRASPRPDPAAVAVAQAPLSTAQALRRHWPEYAIEGAFLAVFLLTAGLASAWAASPGADPAWRRLAAGVVTGLVLVAMIYSPWGRRSGTHLNPAITLAYLRLGKIGNADAAFYLLAQFAGGALAVALLSGAAPTLLPAGVAPASLAVSLGPNTEWSAFLTELVLSTVAMGTILYTSNHARWFRWTGWLVGLLFALVVACAAPLSGFGMNLARLLAVDASHLAGADWLNLLPPLLGMQLAVEGYRVLTGRPQALCAKLAHNTHGPCIFRCQHPYQTRALAMEAIRRRAKADRR